MSIYARPVIPIELYLPFRRFRLSRLSRNIASVVSLSALTFVVFSIFAPRSEASIGVGVQRGPVRLARQAHPGHSYALPSVRVANAGSQDETITVRVERLSAGPGRSVPPSWIHIANTPLRLPANQGAQIPLQLVVPPDAKSGRYLSDIVVLGSALSLAGGTNFGAGAATKLEFTVAPEPARGLLSLLPSWAWLAFGILLVLAAALGTARLSGLRIRVERVSTGRVGTNNPGGPSA
jgi:hypothetical protein